MIGLSGPYDFLPLTDPKLKALFGPEERLRETQPINFVTASEPPLLLMHGLDDTTVLPRNSQRLAAKAKSAGAQATLIEFPGYGHLQMVARLAAPLRLGSSVLDDIARFVGAN
jgi:acetyl esterase/lipase